MQKMSASAIVRVVGRFAETLHRLCCERLDDAALATIAKKCHQLTVCHLALDQVTDAEIIRKFLASNPELVCLKLWYADFEDPDVLLEGSLINDDLVQHIPAICPNLASLQLASTAAGGITTPQGLLYLLENWSKHFKLYCIEICNNTFYFQDGRNGNPILCTVEVFDGRNFLAICEVFKASNVALTDVEFWAPQHINANVRKAVDLFGESIESIALERHRLWWFTERLTDSTMSNVVACCPKLWKLELLDCSLLTDSFLLQLAQSSMKRLTSLHVENSAHISKSGVLPLLTALKANGMEELSFRNCSLLGDATLLVIADLLLASAHQKIQLNIAGTKMNKETVLQLILQGKIEMARGIVCTDASWICDQLKAAGFTKPQLVQDDG